MSGPLYWDTIWLGGNVETEEHIPAKSHASFSRYGLQHEFGCSHSMHGLFQRQLADGIIGLAPRGVIPPSKLTFRNVLHWSFSEPAQNTAGGESKEFHSGSLQLLFCGGRRLHDSRRLRFRE